MTASEVRLEVVDQTLPGEGSIMRQEQWPLRSTIWSTQYELQWKVMCVFHQLQL
jgi:hypothetical protein